VTFLLSLILALSLVVPPAPMGTASWYRGHPNEAAAGPRLRAWLGPHWRNRLVRVCTVADTRHCTTVRLTGWCQCYRGTKLERIIDLEVRSFSRLAPAWRGLVKVRVTLP
jgi:hypothetical protein